MVAKVFKKQATTTSLDLVNRIFFLSAVLYDKESGRSHGCAGYCCIGLYKNVELRQKCRKNDFFPVTLCPIISTVQTPGQRAVTRVLWL